MIELTKSIFDYLRFDILPALEHPCEHCGYFECKKWDLKHFLKKKYADEDMIDYKNCLKRKRKELEEFITILRNPLFRKYADESCEKCGRKMFWRDMKLHSEWERKDPKHPKSYSELKLFRLCPKCNRCYVSGKKPLFKGFERR